MYYTRFIICLLSLVPLICSANPNKKEKVIFLKPEISIHSPDSLSEILPGDSLRVKADILVNSVFKECLFKIVKGGAEGNIDILRKAFDYSIVLSTDGLLLPVFSDKKSKSIDFKIKVKKTAIVGDYILSIMLRDAAGNEREKNKYFVISRP